MQAAVGISQLQKLPAITRKKKRIYDRYTAAFKPIQHKLKPVWVDERCDPLWWFTSFLTETKPELQQYLLNHGIQTRDFFCPLHMQPCYEGMGFDRSDYSLSEKVYSQGISFPSAFCLTIEEQDYIIEKTLEFYS